MPQAEGLWPAVDELIDRVDSPANLRQHRLHLLAAKRWRERGRPVPKDIGLDELRALVRIRASRLLLRKLQDAYDGPIMVLKGLETAAHYPALELRLVHDLDVLVDDAEAAYAAARKAGFVPVGPDERHFSGLHHVRPLLDPDDRSMLLEIHRRPNWVPWALAPSAGELLASAEPSRLGIPGLVAPSPEQHAVITAAHSWGDVPLRRVSDLVDVLAFLEQGDREIANETAARWGLERMWSTTVRAAEALFLNGTEPRWLQRVAPDILEVRDRTVFENHIRTWMGPLLALPPRGAVGELRHALRSELWPRESETWGDRLLRIWQGVRHLDRPNSEHQRLVGTRPEAAG